jgi:hypothetical protein
MKNIEVAGTWFRNFIADCNRTEEGVSESFRTESITKYTHTFGITR